MMPIHGKLTLLQGQDDRVQYEFQSQPQILRCRVTMGARETSPNYSFILQRIF